ncbi:AraC family transcriptional regulator [Granulosicoccus antarcticus]|uniref:Putative HTH-type transcriptional regulator n=1 Tax=Granulosicoccus antarcticus IMCC3135 TaxID=1192854 RepID=A0A2Z2NYQ1_9GAMM|nr:AraC family transcriptional regulator [Granulosicoccus antarcticus]ASJ76443.1 putative HTH-type transcriptional regulator [Granulosicoccus antarcticus IMCC3135]
MSAAPSSSANGLISESNVRALLRAIVDQGHDPREFAEAEGVTLEELQSGVDLSAALFGRLYQRGMLLLRDESLGMVSGGPVARGTFRMMCLCVIHQPTLGAIVTRAGEFMDVCNGLKVKPHIIDDRSSTSIGFAGVCDESGHSLRQILNAAGPMRIRTSLYMWHSLLSWFAGRSIPLRCVEFDFPMPANGAKWTRLFRCPVDFDCEQSLIRFEKNILQLPNVQNEQSLSVFLKSAPYQLIVPSYDDRRLSDRVLALFGNDYSRRLPGADHVSEQLGMSVSTLRRQLQEEGTSFQRLKDDCRRVAAVRYLATSDLTYNEIAGLLGFDEVSAFFRAFRRWTGATPTEYRNSLSQLATSDENSRDENSRHP